MRFADLAADIQTVRLWHADIEEFVETNKEYFAASNALQQFTSSSGGVLRS